MKATGIVRRVDDLGRIVLPMELRRTLNIEGKDSLEIYIDGEAIVLRKFQRGCECCGETDGLVPYKKMALCRKCIEGFVTNV